MKLRTQHLVGALAASCALGMALPPRVAAAISDEEFNQLKDLVIQQGQQVKQQGQRIDQLQTTHEQDQKVHEADQQKIHELEKQLGETQATATNAEAKAEAVATAQAAAPVLPTGPFASHNFTMVGDAEVQFGKTGSAPNTFALADFAPIFLFRARDNVLFEAGFDVTLQNETRPPGGSSTHVNLSFATIDYLFNDYATFVAGDMLLPLGTYNERGAGWLNKIPDSPLPRALLPGSGVGAQVRGAVPLGQSGSAFTYSVYGVNGLSSIDGTGAAGSLDYGGNVGDTPNWHKNPSGGGRVAVFYPWKPHYDIELGVSGQSGEWDDAGQHLYTAMVLDAAVHLSPFVEIKGEYISDRFGSDDFGQVKQCGWWLQAGYKLAGLNLDLPLVNDLELVGRYDTLSGSQVVRVDRYTAGFVYYFSNTLLFEGDYENSNSADPTVPHNGYVLQLSLGF